MMVNNAVKTNPNSIMDSDDRDETVKSVFSDYYSVEKCLCEDDYYVWNSAKSANRGFNEQSHLQHVRNGVDFLFNLYQAVPGDTPFFNREALRRACACFVGHDYHKRKSEDAGSAEQFEISLDDAEEFIEAANLEMLAPTLDAAELRGIMTAHHTSDENALSDSVPHSAIDEYHLVLAADAVASTNSIDEIFHKAIQERVTSALGEHSFKIHTHSVNLESEVINSIANGAIADSVNAIDDWRTLRVFSDGCLYLSLDSNQPSFDELENRLYDDFHDRLADSHLAYADDTIESGGLENTEANYKQYDVSHRDIYYQGAIDTAVGVMQRAIRDANRTANFPKPERIRIEEELQPHVETKIETRTRHVSGLARGLETLYVFMVRSFTTDSSEEVWGRDPVRAMMRIFEVDNEERIEEVEALREANGSRLTAGSQQWLYKYIVAQYIYDKYYDGRDMTSLKNTFKGLFKAKFPDFDGYPDYEDKIGVNKAHTEVAARLLSRVEFNGEEAFEREEFEGDYTCDYCSAQTTSGEDAHGDGHHLLKHCPEIELKTDDGIVTVNGETNLCYNCQIEISTRRSHDSEWSHEDEGNHKIYVHYDSAYGYIPLSWRVNDSLLNKFRNPYTLDPCPDDHANSILSDDEQLTAWDEPNFVTVQDWMKTQRAFYPSEGFMGIPSTINTEGDPNKRYDAITAVIISAVHAGVGVHITKHPMQNTDTSSEEIVSFGEDLKEELTFYGENIELINSKSKIENALMLNNLVDTIGFEIGRIDVLELFSEHTKAPGSRLARLGFENGSDIDSRCYSAAIDFDEEFGIVLPNAESIAQSLESLETDPNEAHSIVSRHINRDIQGSPVSKPSHSVLPSDAKPFHKVAGQQYESSIETATKRSDIVNVSNSIADTIFARLMWRQI
jgi:hypothetical protein